MRLCRYLALMLFIAVSMSAGCSDNVRAPNTMRLDPLGNAYPQNVAIEGLHQWIVVGQPVVDPPTPERPMRVTVPVRSVADRAMNVQYNFTFMDDRGRPVRSDRQSWRFRTVEPRQQIFLETSALDTDAVDWRLEMRPAR